MSKPEEMKYVTYCGLYCGLCNRRSRIPQQSQILRDSMIKDGYDQWGEQFLPNFKEFWTFLNERCKPDKCCPGCRQGGGNPECEIRKCARQRNVDICINCDDYPCRHVSELGKKYSTLIEDGQRLKEISLDLWLQEQTKRAKTGFFYQEDKYEAAIRKRKEHTDAIVNSSSNKKIVVAGPGAGKTYLFEQILEGKSDTLTLTFVNALVEDLSLEFCGRSKVRTLHSFAREIMNAAKKEAKKGTEEKAEEEYIKVFPRLTEVISKDAKILLEEEINFEHLFHNKAAEKKHIDFYKSRKKYYGGYYGFSDIIFAAVMLLEEHKNKIPKFGQVLVDEFQDFNKSEVALIDLLAEKSPILIVGDDDQALYEFKSASPEHIRRRYKDNSSGYAPFSLPYCSRSTHVIVEAVNDIIKAATKNEHLGDRINDKLFKYFDDPDKDKVSDENPQIIYKQLQASQIPFHIQKDIEQTAKKVKKEFRVLILCPTNVQCRTVANALKKKEFINVNFMEKDDKKELVLLDGLKLLLKENNCNLGWRIVSEKLLNDKEFEALLKQTNEDETVRIFDIIKKDLRREVGQILKILRAVRDGKQKKNEPEIAELLEKIDIDAYRMAMNELQEEIKPYNPSAPKVFSCEPEVKKIPITVTTIQSSKGLDADYVFITYFDDQYFIRDEDKSKITDQDICNFLVALTRARNKVFLISSDKNKKPIFLKWIENKRILEL